MEGLHGKMKNMPVVDLHINLRLARWGILLISNQEVRGPNPGGERSKLTDQLVRPRGFPSITEIDLKLSFIKTLINKCLFGVSYKLLINP